MIGIQKKSGLPTVPAPWEYFDLIGGTSTGGIIAILLGRLRLSVSDALKAYDRVAAQAFTPRIIPFQERYSSNMLKNAIQSEVHGATEDRETLYENEGGSKTVVLAITSVDVSAAVTKFKTYDVDPAWKDCKIWEVARATSAATTFFKPIKCGRDKIKFCDAAFGTNNPCEVLVDEAGRAFPNKEIACILSIGTGLSRAVDITGNPVGIVAALKKMATNSKAVDDRMQRSKFNDSAGRVYWRLDEKAGVGDLKLDDWKKLSKLSALTHNYINAPQTEAEINGCVDAILIVRLAAFDGA
jgi:patatin-like phospholipase/acyl hydrolase